MKFWQRLTVYDLYERHVVTDRLLRTLLPSGDAGSILDVGGRKGLLSAYTSWPVVTVNPDGTGDLMGSGASLPFGDDVFEAVVSLDTLEHMPKKSRGAFMIECLRVAKCGFIVAAPFGSVDHIERERKLNESAYAALEAYHPYLNEHILFGLPTLEDLADYSTTVPNTGTNMYYAGDFRWQADAFERSLTSAHWPRLLSIPFNLVQRVAASALFHTVVVRDYDDGTANRFYLVFHKR